METDFDGDFETIDDINYASEIDDITPIEDNSFEKEILNLIPNKYLKDIIINYLTMNHICRLILQERSIYKHEPINFICALNTYTSRVPEFCFIARNKEHGLLMVENTLKNNKDTRMLSKENLIDWLIQENKYVSSSRNIVHICEETINKILERLYGGGLDIRLIKVEVINQTNDLNEVIDEDENSQKNQIINEEQILMDKRCLRKIDFIHNFPHL